ncbi:hypothetical protein TcYC6_0078540 [Trypanosoma cruzi]|nr:hypothetical protein TcYC6_0078540 [Trypanosoma cruzi]
MTIWLHPSRPGARPVDSRPKRGRDYHPIHAHTNAPKQSHIRHQEPQHFMNALNVTGGRAVPEPRASHARHNLSDGENENVATPKWS